MFNMFRKAGAGETVRYELSTSFAGKLEWVSPDGKVREPEETKAEYAYPGSFTAAGKKYTSWKQLCVTTDESGFFARDIYGREVFCMRERFPCFDSYDYLYENRYYRWFFLREGNKLTRVYYTDERDVIHVTEDVRNLESKCWTEMKEKGYVK